MTYYVVTDEGGISHMIEATTPGEAISYIPGGEGVRIALGREIKSHFERQIEEEEAKQEEG